jgi:hypothetical protein
MARQVSTHGGGGSPLWGGRHSCQRSGSALGSHIAGATQQIPGAFGSQKLPESGNGGAIRAHEALGTPQSVPVLHVRAPALHSPLEAAGAPDWRRTQSFQYVT